MTEIISQLRAPREETVNGLSVHWPLLMSLTGQVLLPERRCRKTLVMLWRYSVLSGSSVLLVGRGKKSQWAEPHRSNSHTELCRRDIAGVSGSLQSPSLLKHGHTPFLSSRDVPLSYNKLFSVAKAPHESFLLQLMSPMTRSLTKIVSLKNS